MRDDLLEVIVECTFCLLPASAAFVPVIQTQPVAHSRDVASRVPDIPADTARVFAYSLLGPVEGPMIAAVSTTRSCIPATATIVPVQACEG